MTVEKHIARQRDEIIARARAGDVSCQADAAWLVNLLPGDRAKDLHRQIHEGLSAFAVAKGGRQVGPWRG
jgi:hypothetical protein